MKGDSTEFRSYNPFGSKSVKVVKEVRVVFMDDENNSLPIEGPADSVIVGIKNGAYYQERYFDEEGKPYLDIDYTDHGNPKRHPKVPHEHKWVDGKNGKRIRK